jgi:ribosome production factor 2
MEERKAKTHKGKLYLDTFKPKLIEDPKKCLFINTNNSTEIMRMVLNELYLMRKEFSKKFSRKEDIFNIVQNKERVEFLCTKNNTTFFSLSSHNKKHPMDLTLGILYDHQVLDSFEFEVTNFIPMYYFKGAATINSDLKPIIIFQGELFESDFNYDRLKKFFIDYFQLYDKENVVISQLRRIIAISIENDEKIIKIRNYQVNGDLSNKNSLQKINLVEIGPSFDLKERKFLLADEVLYKKTLKQPKGVKEIKEKNIEKNKILGEKRGRIHMQKQNLTAVSLKKYKKIMNKDRFDKKKKEAKAKENNSENIPLDENKEE